MFFFLSLWQVYDWSHDELAATILVLSMTTTTEWSLRFDVPSPPYNIYVSDSIKFDKNIKNREAKSQNKFNSYVLKMSGSVLFKLLKSTHNKN